MNENSDVPIYIHVGKNIETGVIVIPAFFLLKKWYIIFIFLEEWDFFSKLEKSNLNSIENGAAENTPKKIPGILPQASR